MNIFILASGTLGYEVVSKLFPDLVIVGLATDSNSTALKELAEANNLPFFQGNPRQGNLKKTLDNVKEPIDLILSINYLFIIEADVINYPAKYCLNIHGSLLPKYRGRTPHVWAIINNESVAGITIHVIDEGCDTGPIVGQKKIDITHDMTGSNLLEQYKCYYPELIRHTLKKIESNNLQLRKQDESKATYFGKRTSVDGEINWNWQKGRIRNWVRAQAAPYPGSFTFFNRNKIIIDQVTYFDVGFRYDLPNGWIIDIDPYPLVKVPNGVLALTDIRNEDEINFSDLNNKVLGK